MTRFPREWKVDRLKDVSAINAASLAASTDPDYEFDYLEISNVDYFGVIDRSVIERVRFADAPSRARRVVTGNSTVISSVRPNLQAVAFFPQAPVDLVCSTGFNVVQPDEEKLWPKFAYYVLVSDYARQYFEATATGVGYPAVADKDFCALRIPLPDLSEQIRISAYLEMSCAAIDAVASMHKPTDEIARPKGVLNRQMEILLAYRKSLIYECVTGKRPIAEADLKQVGAHG